MEQIGLLAIRAAAGGALVVVFALISEIVKPKAFAGLFAAAPSVAIASLIITVVSEGQTKARWSSVGMAAGAVGMAACCALAAAVVPRLGALRGSLLAVGSWGVVALGLYWVVFVGDR